MKQITIHDNGVCKTAYTAEDGSVFMSYDECLKRDGELMDASWEKKIQRYIADPNTRVFINHNNEIGRWLYSVEVEGSKGFWLDSFETLQEAHKYIVDNNLSHNSQGDIDNERYV